MQQVIVFGLICISIFLPAGVFASEDIDSIMFDDEVPVEEHSFETEEYSPALLSTVSSEDDYTISNSSSQANADENSYLKSNDTIAQPTEDYLDLQVDDAKSLTSNLEQNREKNTFIPKVEETWVGKLTDKNPLTLLSSDESEDADLEQMLDEAREVGGGEKKSNASVFDISGVMLRMGLKQVDKTMQNRGFRKVMQKYQIPNFIKWRNEEVCRNSGVVGYERLDACINEKAKKDKHQYVQTAQYVKYDTKEDIEVTFSSNFTDNKVFKIVYKSQAANITGNSPKATYLRNIKIYDFWKKINQKYGRPDDETNVTWGIGDNKPFLKAATGYLKLEDPMLRELDYTRMSREDQRYLNTDLYSF